MNWYLLAFNRAAGRMETFALSRCRFIAGTAQHFARLPGFRARAFFKDAFGISQAERPWKVCLLFAKEVAVYVGERAWHPSQRLRQQRDGSLEMRLETSGRKELTRWILSWMPHVRVLAPGELRERMRERLRQGLGALPMSLLARPGGGVPRARASIGHLVREKGQTRGWLPRPLIQQVDGGRV